MLQGAVLVGTEEEVDGVLTVGIGDASGELYLEAYVGHSQRHEALHHFGLYALGGFGSLGSQGVSQSAAFSRGLVNLALKLKQTVVDILDVAQLALEVVAHGDELANALHVIFLFEVVDLVETAVDHVEVGRIEIHLFQLAAYLLGDVLEFDICRLHAR